MNQALKMQLEKRETLKGERRKERVINTCDMKAEGRPTWLGKEAA